MELEWDPAKAGANERKHGVSFYEASEVFGDALSLSVSDPGSSEGEDRYLVFGQTSTRQHVVVSYTERQSRIRIISARLTTLKERKAYEQHL